MPDRQQRIEKGSRQAGEFKTHDTPEQDACGVGFIYRKQSQHATISDAIRALVQLEHRGACAADGVSGDGAGILTEIPRRIFQQEGIEIAETDALAVLFVPRRSDQETNYRSQIAEFLQSRGFNIKAWRRVPVSPEVLGPVAAKSCPIIEHLVISPQETLLDPDRAYIELRLALSNFMQNQSGNADFYVSSLCRKTIVYKAMTTSAGLSQFYRDLTDQRFVANWAVFHRRFSTNTASKWPLAQPFRRIAHNGEINTLRGNVNWLHARLRHLQPDYVVDYAGSDSSILDLAVETLIQDGDSLESAFMKLIPEAHEHHSHLKDHPEIEHFYEFFAPHQEPWDGPALVVFSDATTLGAVLDRNGLRPARFTTYEDGSVILASEVGISMDTEAAVTQKGRLGPGQMIAIDLSTGSLKGDIELKTDVATQHPYGQWLLKERRALKERPFQQQCSFSREEMTARQIAAGYSLEDVEKVITHMVLNDSEPVISMGDDTPLAVLSNRPKKIYEYFKQRFAQVTNPPIDPIRERLVMSLTSYLGRRSPTLAPEPMLAETILLPSPVINEAELSFIESLYDEYKSARVGMYFSRDEKLDSAIDRLKNLVSDQVRNGCVLIILSDREIFDDRIAIPALAAVGAIHHHLIKEGLRLKCSLIVETSQCWTSHHTAALLAYGAQCVLPYLAYETIRHWFYSDSEKLEDLDVESAQANFKSVLDSGLLKIISKMGVSKLTSYVGAQIFECLGLGREVIETCFPGTVSTVGGLSFTDLEREVVAFHQKAFDQETLIDEGIFKNRRHGEFHRNNAELVKALHTAVRLKETNASDETREEQFHSYSKLIEQQPPSSLRELLNVVSDRDPIDLCEVEPVESILKVFCTGGMSLGALSKEAHETLAVAMNRLNARSNSGEGGEDPNRYHPIPVESDGTSKDFPGLNGLKPGDSAASKIRQVASARFGVTPQYLATAEQLEIKIAQGAKPGEGGQLPAHKVSPYIAKLRRTEAGIPLISPPPHHDIYSIEDLAQLIFDLRQVNQAAKISVKLVSEQGIGTVALGCAKAGADIVHVAGHEGGTGAAPAGSIKHAGLPWELGLSETHRFLAEHGMRNRITVRVDGGLRSGLDIVKAALIGADEFAFGTIALIAQGCIMARVCHTNKCPVGIASQEETLRARFHGNPESVVEFFTFVAEEVRYLLAGMGYRSLNEIRGRMDLLRKRDDVQLSKCSQLDLSMMMTAVDTGSEREASYIAHYPQATVCGVNELIVNDPSVLSAIEEQTSVIKAYPIRNTDRAVGASLSGLIATTHGDSGFEGQIVLNFEGSAGQSFAAFNSKNMLMFLKGEANDYVAKGMFGGEVVIRPRCDWSHISPVLVGNTCLYGATGGKLFVAGLAGERFAVRNSGANAVIEGVGDHGCEYMTGGVVAVLGPTGRNFGAGMTGGIAFVLDENEDFASRVNRDGDKQIYRLTPESESKLHALIESHLRLTGSIKAKEILDNWDHFRTMFVQLVPPSELGNAGLSEPEYRHQHQVSEPEQPGLKRESA